MYCLYGLLKLSATIVVVCSWKKSDHSEVDSIWDKNVVAVSCVNKV